MATHLTMHTISEKKTNSSHESVMLLKHPWLLSASPSIADRNCHIAQKVKEIF
jgi:hypothetical protein